MPLLKIRSDEMILRKKHIEAQKESLFLLVAINEQHLSVLHVCHEIRNAEHRGESKLSSSDSSMRQQSSISHNNASSLVSRHICFLVSHSVADYKIRCMLKENLEEERSPRRVGGLRH